MEVGVVASLVVTGGDSLAGRGTARGTKEGTVITSAQAQVVNNLITVARRGRARAARAVGITRTNHLVALAPLEEVALALLLPHHHLGVRGAPQRLDSRPAVAPLAAAAVTHPTTVARAGPPRPATGQTALAGRKPRPSPTAKSEGWS